MLSFQWVTHPHRIENNTQGLRGHRGLSSRARNNCPASEGSLLYRGKRRKREEEDDVRDICVRAEKERERERNDGLERRDGTGLRKNGE